MKNFDNYFKAEIRNIGQGVILDNLVGDSIVSFSIPKSQTLEKVWIFRLETENGYLIEFSSDVLSFDGWQEVGFIKLAITKESFLVHDSNFSTQKIVPFKITALSLLIYSCNEFSTECGIVFYDEKGSSVIVATSPATGAVSIDAFFSKNVFSPEFPIEDCQLESLRAK